MSTLIEAARQALEALEDACGGRCNAEYNPCFQREAIISLRQAIEQAHKRPQNCGTGYCSCIECVMEPEATAWLVEFENGEQELHFEKQAVGETITPLIDKSAAIRIATALGWTPPRQPLTDERLELIGHADLTINNIYVFNGYGEEVPEGRTPIYAGYKAAYAKENT